MSYRDPPPLETEDLPDPFPPNKWKTDGLGGGDNARFLALVEALRDLMRDEP